MLEAPWLWPCFSLALPSWLASLLPWAFWQLLSLERPIFWLLGSWAWLKLRGLVMLEVQCLGIWSTFKCNLLAFLVAAFFFGEAFAFLALAEN